MTADTDIEQKLVGVQCLPCWLYAHISCERGACRCTACRPQGPSPSTEPREHA